MQTFPTLPLPLYCLLYFVAIKSMDKTNQKPLIGDCQLPLEDLPLDKQPWQVD